MVNTVAPTPTPNPVPPVPLCYFFKADRELSVPDVEASLIKLGVPAGRLLPKLNYNKIQNKHWTITVLMDGKIEHDGSTFTLADNTKVDVAVSIAESYVYKALNGAKPIAEFLESLKLIPESEMGVLQNKIRELLNDGAVGIHERVALIQNIKEHLKKANVSDAILKALPQFSTEALGFMSGLTETEKEQVVHSFLSSVVTVAISVTYAVQSFRGVLSAKEKYQTEVYCFLKPMMVTLSNLLVYTTDIINITEKYIEEPDAGRIYSLLKSVDNVALTMKKLVSAIPTIEKSIADYCAKCEGEAKAKKKEMVASFLLFASSLAKVADGLHTVAKEGEKALSCLKKIELTFDGVRGIGYAVEFGAAAYSAYSHTVLLNLAKKQLEFYEKLRKGLDAEKAQELAVRVHDILENNRDRTLLNDILIGYRQQQKSLSEFIQAGKALEAKKRNVPKAKGEKK